MNEQRLLRVWVVGDCSAALFVGLDTFRRHRLPCCRQPAPSSVVSIVELVFKRLSGIGTLASTEQATTAMNPYPYPSMRKLFQQKAERTWFTDTLNVTLEDLFSEARPFCPRMLSSKPTCVSHDENARIIERCREQATRATWPPTATMEQERQAKHSLIRGRRHKVACTAFTYALASGHRVV